jgi:hypothetical protein
MDDANKDKVRELLEIKEDLKKQVRDLLEINNDLKRQLEKARIERDLLIRIVKGA